MSASPDLMMLESAARRLAVEHGMPRSFITVARTMLRHESRLEVVSELEKIMEPWDVKDFQKAAVTPQTFAEVWSGGTAFDMQQAWLESIAPYSILDALRGRASLMPAVGHVLLASGSVANVVAEGQPKAVTRVTLTASEDDERIKSAAIVVMSKDLANARGGIAAQIFENALRDAVIESTNLAALGALPKTGIATTGTAWGDLQAGIMAAGPSRSYVVAATQALTAELAFASDGRMGISGGEPIPGVIVVPHEVDTASAPMTVIPASRVKLIDWGIQIRSAGHASVEMDSAPHMPVTGSTVLVSLWQENLVALLAERSFRIFGADPSIEVG